LLGCLGFSSVALAQLGQVATPGAACAGTYNPNLSCRSNDIEINDVGQLLPVDDPRAQAPVTSCVAGEKVTLDIKFTTLLNANSRYDSVIWIGEEGQNPRGTSGTCYVTSLPDDPDSTFILDLENDGDQCNDTNSSSGVPVDQYLFQVTVDCLDQYTPDPNGTSPDDVLLGPDGELDVFFLITWFQNNTLNCGVGEGFAMEPGVNPRCDAAILTGINVEVLPHATIQVVKNTNVGDGPFDFTSDVPGLGNFTLDTTGDGTESTAVIPLDGPEVGQTYNIAETLPTGWILDSATCSNGDTPDAVTPLDTQDVVCTFTNTLDTATINVVKNTVGGNGLFAVNWLGPTTSGGVALDTGVINTDTETVVTTETGTFVLQELIPEGWVLSNAGCVNDNGGAGVGTWDTVDTINGIDLSPGDSITCTFTNAVLGSVTLIKNTVGGDGSFDFVTDVPGLGSNITTSGGTGAISASNVPQGVYSIVETVPAGWNLDSAICSDGSPPDALDVSDGETVTCTFTNTKLGTVIVEKQTLPDGSGQTFEFTGDIAGTIGDGGQIIVNNLLPATYNSTETFVAGWALTSIICDDGNSTGNTESGQATFNVEAGETVTCVFTNTQDGSIEVVKSLSATGPAVELFGFTSNFNGTFTLEGDAATTGPISVVPGSGYTVSEDDPSANGWVNTASSCNDGSNPLTDIAVSPGETVVCTFTNTPLGSATIVKETIGGDGTFDFTGTAPFDGLQLTTLEGTASQDFTFQLLDGQYLVTEQPVPAGWSLTGLDCVEDGLQDSTWLIPTATMEVQLAETVTCTFTNTADGTLIIRKETIPDGAAQGFDFTGDASGTIHDYSATAEEIVVSGLPGTYTSVESPVEGWVLTDISCTGQVQSGVTYGDADVSVDLAAGETVICTFENSVQGSITIEKLTQGDVGAFQFNGAFGPFLLDTNNSNPDSVTYTNLLPDSYMFSEIVPLNWTLTDISCSGATNSTITIGGEGDFTPGDLGVTIDYVDGESIVCTFVNDADGSITVTKLTDPAGSAQSFDFTGAITASLTDGQSSTTVMVPAGNYDVTESAVAGWDVTNISCDDDNSTGTGNTANLVVASGEDVTCTFTNTIQLGNIVVVKQTDPDGSSEDFGFTSNYGGAFSLTDGQQNDSGPLLPSSEAGAYSVAEDAEAGWDLTSAVCTGDGNTPASITLLPNETVTCTFTNTIQRGSIVVDKVTVPAGSLQLFDFTLTGTNVNLAFALADATAPYNSGELLPTSENGTYNVAEAAIAGWVGVGVCSDGSPIDAVDVAPGEVVTCTFTNTIQPGTIIVDKVTDPAGSAQMFDFTLTGTGVNQAFQLADATAPYNSGELLPTSENGTYNVAEAAVAGWVGVGVCSDSSPVSAVDLSPGETVTCTFTNTIQSGGITIVKRTDIDGTFWFDFSGPDYGAYLVSIETSDRIGQASFENLPPGSYSIYEQDAAPFILLSATCNNGDDPASVTLDEGENVICTFVNGQPVPVPANSLWSLLLLTLMLLATGWYFRPAGMRRF
jgi:hypothetical protein